VPEVDARILRCRREGDLIKGALNHSAVGKTVQRVPVRGLVFLAKMDGATAMAAVNGFSGTLNRLPEDVRKTFTYHQASRLVHHFEITQN